MNKTASQALQYERTGTIKSKRKDIDRGVFKDMPSGSIISGSLSELWRRYSSEILAVLLFSSWGLYIWNKLG